MRFLRFVLTLLLFVPVAIESSPVASLHRGLDAATRFLYLVRNKYIIVVPQVDALLQGINNLRRSQITDSQIASLESSIIQLTSMVQRVLVNPALLDRMGLDPLYMVDKLTTLGKILPANRNDFDAMFRWMGPYNMIWQAMTQIYAIVQALGY